MEEHTAPRQSEVGLSQLTRGALLRRLGIGAGTVLAASALASRPELCPLQRWLLPRQRRLL